MLMHDVNTNLISFNIKGLINALPLTKFCCYVVSLLNNEKITEREFSFSIK